MAPQEWRLHRKTSYKHTCESDSNLQPGDLQHSALTAVALVMEPIMSATLFKSILK